MPPKYLASKYNDESNTPIKPTIAKHSSFGYDLFSSSSNDSHSDSQCSNSNSSSSFSSSSSSSSSPSSSTDSSDIDTRLLSITKQTQNRGPKATFNSSDDDDVVVIKISETPTKRRLLPFYDECDASIHGFSKFIPKSSRKRKDTKFNEITSSPSLSGSSSFSSSESSDSSSESSDSSDSSSEKSDSSLPPSLPKSKNNKQLLIESKTQIHSDDSACFEFSPNLQNNFSYGKNAQNVDLDDEFDEKNENSLKSHKIGVDLVVDDSEDDFIEMKTVGSQKSSQWAKNNPRAKQRLMYIEKNGRSIQNERNDLIALNIHAERRKDDVQLTLKDQKRRVDALSGPQKRPHPSIYSDNSEKDDSETKSVKKQRKNDVDSHDDIHSIKLDSIDLSRKSKTLKPKPYVEPAPLVQTSLADFFGRKKTKK